MEENKELETVTESQRNAGKGLFLSGIIVGFAATLLVVGGIFIAFQIHRIVTVKDDVSAQVFYDEDSAVNAQTIKKLQLLEDTVKENFYLSEVTNEQLEDGMYRGLMEALDDPYSEYYTAEELTELTEQTQGIYYGIGAYVSMDTDTNLPKISGVIEGSPAAGVDLRANDLRGRRRIHCRQDIDGSCKHDPRRRRHHSRPDHCQTGCGRLSPHYGRESQSGKPHRKIRDAG